MQPVASAQRSPAATRTQLYSRGALKLRLASVLLGAMAGLSGCLPPVDGLCESTIWYADFDGDGFGNAQMGTLACVGPAGSVTDADDCDDQDPGVFPGADEVWYDGADTDCGGDDDYDLDGDGQASALFSGEDCDDEDPGVYAGAEEIWYDGVDQDCGADDDYDMDGDGVSTLAGDCADEDAAVGPFAEETCDDGIDNNCDGSSGDCAPQGDWDLIEEVTWTGATRNEAAGTALLAPGDLNGDGVADLAVGAPGGNGDTTMAGVVYVVTGPPPGSGFLSSTAGTLLGEEVLDSAGAAMGSADLDGDGQLDLVVGAPYRDDSGSESGLAYLVLGPIVGDMRLAESDGRLAAGGTGDHVGAAIAAVGDIDGDGAQDMAIGAPSRDRHGTEGGGVWLLRGPQTGSVDLGELDLSVSSRESGAQAGSALTGGDLDGDGLSDLAVGAPRADAEDGTGCGRVSVRLGPVAGNVDLEDADFTVLGDAAGDRAGSALAIIADQDGDGLAELLIGAPEADEIAVGAGSAFVVSGLPKGEGRITELASARLLGTDVGGRAASAVADAGDVDGDGWTDLLIGAPNSSDISTSAGEVWLALGPVEGSIQLGAVDVRIYSELSDGLVGGAVVGAGDLDADGHADLLIGAPGAEVDGVTGAGAASLLYGYGL